MSAGEKEGVDMHHRREQKLGLPLPIAAAQLPPSFPIQNAFQDESILISIQQAERSSEIILPDLILV